MQKPPKRKAASKEVLHAYVSPRNIDWQLDKRHEYDIGLNRYMPLIPFCGAFLYSFILLCRSKMNMKIQLIVFTAYVVQCMLPSFATLLGNARAEECRTLPMIMMVQKNIEEESTDGNRQIVCSGKVVVNKCEGSCASHVFPNFGHVNGFKTVSNLITFKKCVQCKVFMLYYALI